MKIDKTYGIYRAIMRVTEKVGLLAQMGDADAQDVIGRLKPVAELLGGQLRRKLALAIAEMEAEPAGSNLAAVQGSPLVRRRNVCRVRAS